MLFRSYFVARLDWPLFIQSLKKANIYQLLVSTLLVLLSLTIRSFRWHLVCCASSKQFKNFWHAGNLGYLGNLVLPARAGEVLRIQQIKKASNMPLSQLIIGSLIDRVSDVLTISIVILLIISGVISGHIDSRISLFGQLTLWAILFTFVALYLTTRSRRTKIRIKKLIPHLLLQKLTQSKEAFTKELVNKTVCSIVLISPIVFVIDFGALWLTLHAMKHFLPFTAAIVTTIGLMIGSIIPSTPGQIGIFQAAFVISLALYNVGETEAIAVAVIFQTICIIATTLVGTYSFLAWKR